MQSRTEGAAECAGQGAKFKYGRKTAVVHADALGAAADALRLCEDDGYKGEHEGGSEGVSGVGGRNSLSTGLKS